MKELRIGFLQQHNTADTRDNLLRLAEGISDLAKRGAELIVLQELHNSLYFCQTENVENFDLAEPIPGPSTQFFGELAKKFGVVIVTSLFEKRAPGLYHNTAVVLEKDGSIAGITIMDNPSNFRFPTYWHVRNYGLMTANPFGLSYFYNDKSKDGSYTIKAGEPFVFQYRVFIHSGSTKEATVGNRYHDYINPAKVTAE